MPKIERLSRSGSGERNRIADARRTRKTGEASLALVTRSAAWVGPQTRGPASLLLRVRSSRKMRKSTASTKRPATAEQGQRNDRRVSRYGVAFAAVNSSPARYAPSPSRCALTRRRRSRRQPPASRTSRKPRLVGGRPAEQPPERASRTKSVM